jgi:hypothetical protein
MAAGGGYHHYRLPLIRAVHGLIYRLVSIAVQRVWHVRRALRGILAARGGRFALLDMGCGLGDDIFALAPSWPDATFRGVDHVAANVLICRAGQELRRLGNVTFLEADIQDPGRPPRSMSPFSPPCCGRDDPVVPLSNARQMLNDGVMLVFRRTPRRRRAIGPPQRPCGI